MTLRRSQSWRHRNTYCCLSFISWRLLFCALHKTTNVQTSCYRTFKELWFRSNGSLRCHHLTNKVRRTFQIRFPSRVSTPIYFSIVFKQTIVDEADGRWILGTNHFSLHLYKKMVFKCGAPSLHLFILLSLLVCLNTFSNCRCWYARRSGLWSKTLCFAAAWAATYIKHRKTACSGLARGFDPKQHDWEHINRGKIRFRKCLK